MKNFYLLLFVSYAFHLVTLDEYLSPEFVLTLGYILYKEF